MKNDLLIDTRLGAYRILALLGEGGMARVYKATHERLHREVAIKVIRPEAAGEADFRRRFEQEAQLIASLQHRNIVTVYDFGDDRGMIFLAMQYVSGGTLRDQLIEGQPLEPRRAALYALQMARALNHAHQYGIVHRDVKPLNMLVSATNRNELLLSDFGLAKLFASNAEAFLPSHPSQIMETDHAQSVVGGIAGTPRYMAPEQCLGKLVDARTDIYALGVVLFEMLTGRPLFQGETVFALLHQHAYKPAPPVHEINPAVPEALAQITARALAKQPEDRFQSAREMGQALEGFLSPPVIVVQRTSSRRSRFGGHSLIYLLVSTLLILVVAAQILSRGALIHWLVPSSSVSTQGPSQPDALHPAPCVLAPRAPQAQPFIETFQDNSRGWPMDSGNGITPTLAGHTYTIGVANSSLIYFLCPDSASVGTLPRNFSLTAQIVQREGGSDAVYGIAIRAGVEQGTDKAYGYAFVINGQGHWGIFRYDPHVSGGYSPLRRGIDTSAISKAAAGNTLQVIDQGGRLSFKINNSVLPINGEGQKDQTLPDSSTGGQLALLVSGPNTSFMVISVKLAVP